MAHWRTQFSTKTSFELRTHNGETIVEYSTMQGKDACWKKGSEAVDIGLPSPLDNLEIGNGFDARHTRSYLRAPLEWKEGFIRLFCLFFCFVFPPLVYLFWSREVLLGWWRGCPGEATRMAAWFTFTIAFSTTLISQVWRRMRHLPLWSQRQHGELRLSV